MTIVDNYWSEHTVRTKYFKNQKESQKYSILRLTKTPLHKEFMELTKSYKNKTILDYGCGPGNDLVNFILWSKAKKIIGMDISEKALNYAKHQTFLFVNNNIPIEFVKIIDTADTIPLKNNSIDYIICTGVLQHVSYPLIILKEFFRILKNNSFINIMVYNYNSIFFHINIAYLKRGGYKENNIDEVFAKNTDGPNCPISKYYKPEEFKNICNNIGFQTEYVGGYLSEIDSLRFLNEHKQNALNDNNLAEEHKNFLCNIKINSKGYPTYNNKVCGIGGVYKLYKK